MGMYESTHEDQSADILQELREAELSFDVLQRLINNGRAINHKAL